MISEDQRAALKQLVRKAQVCGLQNNPLVAPQLRSVINLADQEKRMLSDDEITLICAHTRRSSKAITSTIKTANNYVDRCKQTLLSEQPSLFQEGGALYPSERSEACWRDCWNFLRVAIYAMATNTPQCTDPEGIKVVRQLYALMNVPVSGMNLALSTLSQLITTDLRHQGQDPEAVCIDNAFAHMRTALHKD